MKIISIIILLIFTSCLVKAQDCSKVKYGKFKLVLELDTMKIVTTIERVKNIQSEESSTGVKMQFEVKWTSSCSYELSKPKVLKGEMTDVNDQQILYVKILNVTPTYYTAEISSNFADLKLVKDIQIVQ
ncbi:MAG TPA: hypothetical protein VGQ09_16135 [Chitinophagaceae bacterium]|jgi:hypothetical protein|nr:hypothetical protein [Chitinophagaceae bacterium]